MHWIPKKEIHKIEKEMRVPYDGSDAVKVSSRVSQIQMGQSIFIFSV